MFNHRNSFLSEYSVSLFHEISCDRSQCCIYLRTCSHALCMYKVFDRSFSLMCTSKNHLQERERQRDTETQRHRDRETQRETERQRERNREREREREKERERDRERAREIACYLTTSLRHHRIFFLFHGSIWSDPLCQGHSVYFYFTAFVSERLFQSSIITSGQRLIQGNLKCTAFIWGKQLQPCFFRCVILQRVAYSECLV